METIPPQDIVDRLVRLWSDSATADDAAAVRAWLAEAPNHALQMDALRRVWDAELPFVYRGDLAKFRAGVHAHLREHGVTVHPSVQRMGAPLSAPRVAASRDAMRSPFGSWAIGAALAAAVSIFVFLGIQRERTAVPSPVVYTTTHGQRTTVKLADGSTVILAPETRLAYAVDASGARVIRLDGEAFFSVEPHTAHPFVVYTGAVATRVLGTAFDVRRYAGERTTQVAVMSGRVTTGGRGAPAVIAAGMLARASDSTVTVSAAADPTRAIGWTAGQLVFDDTPVPDMLATLGRWYGYEFRLTDSALAASHVSMAFRTNEPVETLNMVKAILGVTMSVDGNVITLRPKQTTTHAPLPKSAREFLTHSKPEVGR